MEVILRVDIVSPLLREINFTTDWDTAQEFKEFGRLSQYSDFNPQLFCLYVDSRFNFEKVLDWIVSYEHPSFVEDRVF